jgi:membrane protein implicated in regulation of membrane protease activity
MSRLNKIWQFLDDHNPCPDAGIFGWLLIIFGILLGIGFLAPWIGIALGVIVLPFVILRMLYYQHPHMVTIAVIISVAVGVTWLARSYNRYKREKSRS